MISGLRRDVDEICALLVYNAVFLEALTLEDGADRLSRNVGKELPLDAA
jgi:hypothetical protein